jgi:hypothetical protein
VLLLGPPLPSLLQRQLLRLLCLMLLAPCRLLPLLPHRVLSTTIGPQRPLPLLQQLPCFLLLLLEPVLLPLQLPLLVLLL